ncbi:MAG: ATP synthase F1 subunit gamma [Vampirovibrionales bacterium]|nr:ATP synthase F1 subunit gamma [Vampirovibrionales bacterium]
MPNLKDIRRRIKSVKSTQKITQAMRMVAAAKVKRAENRIKNARPYLGTLNALMSRVVCALKANGDLAALEADRVKNLSLLQSRPIKTVGLLILTSDRGLCGAYNANVLRQALQLKQLYESQALKVKLYAVGSKAVQAFSRLGVKPDDFLGRMSQMSAAPTVSDARQIVATLSNAYQDSHIDQLVVLSTRFRSLISFKVEKFTLLPLDATQLTQDTPTSESVPSETTLTPTSSELLLEPSPAMVLDNLVPMYLQQTVFGLLLDAAASELGARMTAMANASNNARDMLNRLTLLYNKARQTSITQEILEVVSGAEALR